VSTLATCNRAFRCGQRVVNSAYLILRRHSCRSWRGMTGYDVADAWQKT